MSSRTVTNRSKNRVRTGLLTAALAGGTLFGATQLGGIVNAQTDETPAEENPAEDTTAPTEEPTDEARDTGEREHRGQALADVLGIETAELREQLRDGATLAEIAEANGVDVQSVIDVIVTQMSEHLDRAVENGHIDAAEADDKLTELEERATAAVNEAGGPLEGRRGGRGGERHAGECDDDPAEADDAATDAASESPGEESLVLVES